MIKNSRYAVIFVGMGLTQQVGKELTIANLVKFSQEAHEYTKVLIEAMRGHGNVKGAGMLLTWRTGYPFMVDFSRGYPRYFPGETSIVDLLARGEVDAALVIASDPVANLPATRSRSSRAAVPSSLPVSRIARASTTPTRLARQRGRVASSLRTIRIAVSFRTSRKIAYPAPCGGFSVCERGGIPWLLSN